MSMHACQVLSNGITRGAKKMRLDVVFSVNSPNVTCVGTPEAPYIDYKQVLADMNRSIFCLVLPGECLGTEHNFVLLTYIAIFSNYGIIQEALPLGMAQYLPPFCKITPLSSDFLI